MKKGKFIVLYGINNIGKTTQAEKLVQRLKENGKKAEYIKYPIYNLEPAGPLINSYLRKDNPHNFSPREFQILCFIDRIKFEPKLKEKLIKGVNVVAEDYFGTAVAWGIGEGVSQKLLEYFYSFVLKEDLAILFDGKRFSAAAEKKHKHENDEKLIKEVRKIHLMLSKKYKWQKIEANLPVESVAEEIWQKVSNIL